MKMSEMSDTQKALVVKTLKKVRSLLRPGGRWIQGAYHEHRNGHECYCLVGAINEVAGTASAAHRLRTARALCHVAGAKGNGLIAWNDRDGRKKREVLELLDTTIAELSA